MAQHSDGAIVVSTKIDNSGVGPGTRQFKAQVRDMETSVQKTGRNMADGMDRYVNAMRSAHTAARSLASDQKAIQSEIKKTEDRIARLADRQELARRKWDASREAAIAKASEEFEKNNAGMELMPWEDEEKAAEQFAEDSIANIQRVIDKFGEFEDTAPFTNTQTEIDMLNDRLTELRAQYAALADSEDEVSEGGEEMSAVLVRTSGGAASSLGAAFAKVSAGALNALASLAKFAGNSAVTYLRKLASGARNAAIQLAKLSASAIRSGLSKLGSMIGGATRSMMGFNRANRQINGGMGMSLKNLLRYGLGIRSLFALFNRLRNAIKEGFEQMSKSSPEVNNALNTLRASLNGLKGSLATAFAPVVTAVAPALTTLMNYLTAAINTIGAFFAALSGKSSYQKAVVGLNSIGSAASGAGGKVNDLKRQLAGFDQLDILGSKDSGGGGGGSSGGGSALAYETEQIGSGIADYVKKLKELWEAADYEGIGRVIGEGINNAFAKAQEMISWDNLGTKLTTAVNTISGIVNGLTTSINWDLIGRTFGTGVNTLITAANKLLTDINWTNLGVGLANGLNGLVDEIDFINLGDTIGLRFQAALETIGSFLATFDFGNLAAQASTGFNAVLDRLIEAINNVEWQTIGENLGTAINNLISGISWDDIAEVARTGAGSLITAIKRAVSKIKWGDAGTKLSTALNKFFADKDLWKDAGETISTTLEGLLDFSKQFVITFDEKAAAKSIKTALGRIKWSTIATDFWDTVKLAFEKAGNMLKIILGGDLYDIQGDAVEQMWERGSGDTSSATYAETWVHRVAETVGKIIGGVDWPGLFETAKKAAMDAISGFVKGLFDSENGWFIVKMALAIGALKTVIPTLIGGISTTITSSFVATKVAGKLAAESAATGIETAGVSAFSKAAGAIETSALLALDAVLVAYDYNKIKEAAEGYKEAGEAYEKEIDTALAAYKKLYEEKGKEVADAWAENVYGIDTTNTSLADSQQLLVDSITTLWGDAPKNWKDALREGWETYFGKDGKGIGGLFGDATEDFRKWLYENDAQLQETVEAANIKKEDPNLEKLRAYALAVDTELKKGRSLYSLMQEAYELGWTPDEIKEIAKTFGIASDTIDKWLGEYEFSAAWDEMLNDQEAQLDVTTTFISSADPNVKDRDLFNWITALFAPGTDMETRVALIKQGWETVSNWVGGQKGATQITQAVGLFANAWSTVSDWVSGKMGAPSVTELISLSAHGWTTVKSWLGIDNPLTAFLNLAKSAIGKQTADEVYSDSDKAITGRVSMVKGSTGQQLADGLYTVQDKAVEALTRLKKGSTGNQTAAAVYSQADRELDAWVKMIKAASGAQTAQEVYSVEDRRVTGRTQLAKGNSGAQTAQDVYSLADRSVTGRAQLAKGNSGAQSVSEVYNSSEKAVSGKVSLEKNGWTSIAAFVGTAVTTVVNLSNSGSNWVSGLAQWITGNRNGTVSITTNLVAGAVTGFAQSIKKVFFGATGGIATANGLRAFAGGGIITSGAARYLSNVPHYASGTTSAHGTVFVAGEAGPEIMGHINGRTEILNRSQIAQAVYGAVVAGMGQAVNALGRYLAERMAVCTNAIISTLDVRMPVVATGTLMPYEVSAQIARSTADIQGTLDANNEDLIQTIISVAGQIVAAVRASDKAGAGVTGGPTTSQLIDEINRRTLMMGTSPIMS